MDFWTIFFYLAAGRITEHLHLLLADLIQRGFHYLSAGEYKANLSASSTSGEGPRWNTFWDETSTWTDVES